MYSLNLPSRVANCASRAKKLSKKEQARVDAHYAAERARKAKFLADLGVLLGGEKAEKATVLAAIAKLGGLPHHWFDVQFDALKAWAL